MSEQKTIMVIGAHAADAELMGLPTRVTVSDRLIEQQRYEVTDRASGETTLLTRSELIDTL